MKKIYRYILLLSVVMLIGQAVNAQQIPFTTHYTFNQYSLDPAFAGSFENKAIFMNYRRDWAGIDGAPQTYRLNGFGNIFGNMYLGGELMVDNTDIFNRLKASLNYSYRLQMAEEQFLSVSLTGSLFQSVVRFDQVVADQDDPLLKDLTRVTGTDFNAGFSVVYNRRNLHIGLGMPMMVRTKNAYLQAADGKFAFERAFMMHISDRYQIAPDWDLQTFIVYQKTDNEPGVLDVSGTFIYDNRYWASLLYRNSGVLAIGVGGELGKGVVLGYTYEIGTGGINSKSGGAHEISLGFRMSATGGRTKFYEKRHKAKKPSNSRWGDYRTEPYKPTPIEYNKRRVN